MGIGYGLLVLFFAIGVFSSAASFRELQRPEFALRHFIRLVLAKVAVGRGMEMMTAIFSICGSVVSASMNGIGGAVETAASLPVEIVNAIEGVSFLQGRVPAGRRFEAGLPGRELRRGRKQLRLSQHFRP